MKRNHHLNTTYQINPIVCEAPCNKVQNRYNYPGYLKNPLYSGEAGSYYLKRNYRIFLLEVPAFQCSTFKVNCQVWTRPVSGPSTRFQRGSEKNYFPFLIFSHFHSSTFCTQLSLAVSPLCMGSFHSKTKPRLFFNSREKKTSRKELYMQSSSLK